MTWSEAVDEALCFGWIDGVRHSIDETSYRNRFTPRKPRSTWSKVNIAKVEALEAAGKMSRRRPGGVRAPHRGQLRHLLLRGRPPPRRCRSPTRRCSRPTRRRRRGLRRRARRYYRRAAVHWVTSAKREATRERRLAQLDRVLARGRGGAAAQARRDAGADRAGDAGAAEPAVAVRVLGQVLLVVVLGVVERPGLGDLGRDLAVARPGRAAPGTSRATPSAASRWAGVVGRSPSGTGCRRRCPGACPASGRGSPRTASASPRRRSRRGRRRRARPRCGWCARSTPPRRSGSASGRPRSRRRWCRRPGACQNTRSAPQKQPMPKTARLDAVGERRLHRGAEDVVALGDGERRCRGRGAPRSGSSRLVLWRVKNMYL